jgi:hypothetical protein
MLGVSNLKKLVVCIKGRVPEGLCTTWTYFMSQMALTLNIYEMEKGFSEFLYLVIATLYL